MIRITGGEFAGRRLKMIEGPQSRPTSQKVRQALFNILAHRAAGSTFLDLFAGVGTVGLEALSRGADRAVFVEKNPRVAEILAANIETLGVAPRSRIWTVDALLFHRRTEEKFDIIFVDPPYLGPLADLLIRALGRKDLLKGGGIVVVEHYFKTPLPSEEGNLALSRTERYGQTGLSFYKGANA